MSALTSAFEVRSERNPSSWASCSPAKTTWSPSVTLGIEDVLVGPLERERERVCGVLVAEEVLRCSDHKVARGAVDALVPRGMDLGEELSGHAQEQQVADPDTGDPRVEHRAGAVRWAERPVSRIDAAARDRREQELAVDLFALVERYQRRVVDRCLHVLLGGCHGGRCDLMGVRQRADHEVADQLAHVEDVVERSRLLQAVLGREVGARDIVGLKRARLVT